MFHTREAERGLPRSATDGRYKVAVGSCDRGFGPDGLGGPVPRDARDDGLRTPFNNPSETTGSSHEGHPTSLVRQHRGVTDDAHP